jgi:uncharacterized protein (TIGR02466 family)
MSIGLRIGEFFSTYVLRADYPLSTLYDRDLLALAYATRESDSSGREWSKDQYGIGYTSYSSDLCVADHTAVSILSSFVIEQAVEFARYLSIDLDIVTLRIARIWFNINPAYAYHGEHMHADALFSGVYYVQTPPNSGRIVFRDPRLVTAFIRPPFRDQTTQNGESVAITPRPGLLVMFPGWLAHSVEQNRSSADRISIAFNIVFTMNSPPNLPLS